MDAQCSSFLHDFPFWKQVYTLVDSSENESISSTSTSRILAIYNALSQECKGRVTSSLEGIIHASQGTLAKWSAYNEGCRDGMSESRRVNTTADALTDR